MWLDSWLPPRSDSPEAGILDELARELSLDTDAMHDPMDVDAGFTDPDAIDPLLVNDIARELGQMATAGDMMDCEFWEAREVPYADLAWSVCSPTRCEAPAQHAWPVSLSPSALPAQAAAWALPPNMLVSTSHVPAARGQLTMTVLRRRHRHQPPVQQNTATLARIFNHTFMEFTARDFAPGTTLTVVLDRRIEHMRADYAARPLSSIEIHEGTTNHGTEVTLVLPCNGAVQLVLVPEARTSRAGQRPRFSGRVLLNDSVVHQWQSEVFSATTPARKGVEWDLAPNELTFYR